MHASISPDEFKAHKRGVGHVLYEFFAQILNPLYVWHRTLHLNRVNGMNPLRFDRNIVKAFSRISMIIR